MSSIRLKNINRLLIGNLNINSISGKFDQLKILVQGKLDVLVITETKLDSSFPKGQFLIEGFSEPYRFDRNRHGGGILIYVREDISSKELKKYTFPGDIEGIFVEINLRKVKWLLFGSYHPPSQSDNYYFDNVTNALDLYCQTYDKLLLIGDFNAEDSEPCLSRFLYEHNSKNLVKDKTCFKSLENPSCIDLFLTNSPLSFQNTVTMSTGLSDCHKMVITVLKSTFAKTKPKEIIYRDYKKFNADFFKSDLKVALSNEGDVIHRYALFEKIFLQVLDKHAPLRKKLLRANHAPYITKSVRKAIMRRSQLESKFLKHKTPESRQIYTKQRNYCSRLYKKERKKYYNNLNINKITDNKQFWQTVKPLLSEKGTRFAHINLVDNEKIISEDRDVAQTLNNFFENAVKSLGIKENQYILSNTGESADPVDIALNKFEHHPSILAIKENISFENMFTFSSVTVEEILSEISSLDSKKAGTFKNIPTKHLKETSDICSEYLLKLKHRQMSSFSFW